MAVPGEAELIGRVAIAAGLGAVVGLERALRDKESGIRTLALVCLGSCAFTVAGYGFLTTPGAEALRPDPGRIAAQIVTGIGFLGAGVIFVARGERIRGMTSAADIWVVAAIGILAGTGLYYTALAVTGLDLAVVVLLRPLVFWLRERNGHGAGSDGGEAAD